MSVMFQTVPPHKDSSSKGLCRYLYYDREGNIRALAQDFSPLVSKHAAVGSYSWGQEFDNWRKLYNKDFDRTLYHFELSPSLEDEATLEQLRLVAQEWANKHFANTMWTITYHDDNINHILHAHVAVCSVMTNGKKLHFNSKQWAELANTANDIGAKYGLDKRKLDKVLTPQERYKQKVNSEQKEEKKKTFTDKEKRARAANFKTHKDKIREAISFAKKHSSNWKEFETHMRAQGINPRPNKQNGVTYYFLEPIKIKNRIINDFAVKDKKLEYNEGEKQFVKEEIVKSFNFNADSIMFDNKLNKNKINAVRLDYLMKKNFSNVRAQDKRFANDGLLPKLDSKEIEKKFINGKQTKASVKKTIKDVDAIMGALNIANELNATTKIDLEKEVAKLETKIEKLKTVIEDKKNEQELVKVTLDYLTQYNYPLNDEQKQEAKTWLEKHEIDFGSAAKFSTLKNNNKEVLKQLHQQQNTYEKKHTNIKNAYSTINTILDSKYKHMPTRTTRTETTVNSAELKVKDFSKINTVQINSTFISMQQKQNGENSVFIYTKIKMKQYKHIKNDIEQEQTSNQQYQQQEQIQQQSQKTTYVNSRSRQHR